MAIEGKNKVTIKDSCYLKCNGNGGMDDNSWVFVYQTEPGDPNIERSTFNCQNSNIEIMSSSSVFSSAPLFYITNTQTEINLEECNLIYGSQLFLNASKNSHWGTLGENGADVKLNLINQNIEGDFIVNENSTLDINMVNSTIKGCINNKKTASGLKITLDSKSSITLTGNSYYTSIINSDITGSNIINGTYILSYYNGNLTPKQTSYKYLRVNYYIISATAILLLFLLFKLVRIKY